MAFSNQVGNNGGNPAFSRNWFPSSFSNNAQPPSSLPEKTLQPSVPTLGNAGTAVGGARGTTWLQVVLVIGALGMVGTVAAVLSTRPVTAPGNNGSQYRTPVSLGSFGEGAPVYGLYKQNDAIYAIRDSTPYVQTFSATAGNQPQMNLTLTGTQGPYDMVGIAQPQSIFILDWFNWNNVTTVNLQSVNNGQSQFSLLETQYSSFALSATASNTIVATCSASQTIREFSPTGQLIRQVYVNVTQPRHTIKLRSGRGYAMCHGYGTDQLHRVCLLDNSGAVLSCYGSTNGSAIGHLDVPARVLEDDYGSIWVADLNNKRIVVLSASLGYVATLVSAADGLQGPYRLLLDGQILYVADNTVTAASGAVSGRILAFKLQPQ